MRDLIIVNDANLARRKKKLRNAFFDDFHQSRERLRILRFQLVSNYVNRIVDKLKPPGIVTKKHRRY